MEHELIEEGLPEDEVKALCNRHADVFRLSPREPETPAARGYAGSPGLASESDVPPAIPLDTGYLTPEQLNLILTGLPVDSPSSTNGTRSSITRRQRSSYSREARPSSAGLSRTAIPKASTWCRRYSTSSGRQKRRGRVLGSDQGRFLHIRYFAIRDSAGTTKARSK